MTSANAKTSPRRTKTALRTLEALNLRAAGLSYYRIAEKLNISKEAARKLIINALQDLSDLTFEERFRLRALENTRLDQLQLAYWPKAVNGDISAADFILRLINTRIRLNGLDTLNIAVSPESQPIKIIGVDHLLAALAPLAPNSHDHQLDSNQGQTA